MYDDDPGELSTARTSAILGISALTLLASMCCTSFMGVFGGLMVGAIGLWMAFTQREVNLGPVSQAYHQIALAANGIATGLGCLFSIAIAAYLGIYMAAIAAVVIGGLI